jgi:hypothetical protein
VTIYPRHGNAAPPPLGSLATEMPAGRLLQLFRLPDVDPTWVYYAGEILPTSKGKDLQTVILGGAMTGSSIRSRKIESEWQETDDGAKIRVLLDGYIEGVDFADDPAIVGAGVYQLLENTDGWRQLTEDDLEETDMEIKWEEVTLELLREHKPDLLASLEEAAKSALLEQIATLESNAAEITRERDALKASLDALGDTEAKIGALEADLGAKVGEIEAAQTALAEARTGLAKIGLENKMMLASQDQLTALIHKNLAEVCETEADIEANFKEARDKAYLEFAVTKQPKPVRGAGVTRTENEDQPKAPELTAEQKEQIRFL